MVCGIQSHAVERLAQAWVVVVGALKISVLRIRYKLPEHTLAGKCCVFCIGVHHGIYVIVAREQRFVETLLVLFP